jgi:probable rRNA maturation factor
VSDARIAQVHGQFFDDPTPTDVITFQHGEILIGAETVAENAVRYRHSPDDEAALCVVHGLLHLAGWDDLTARDAKQMAKMQEQIFKTARKMID